MATASASHSEPVRPFRHALGANLGMVLLPALLLALGPATVLMATGTTPGPAAMVSLAVAGLPVVTPVLLRLAGRQSDPLLLSPVWVLCALGLMVVARVQPDLLPLQMLWITGGWFIFIVVVSFPPLLATLHRYRYQLLAGALLLAVITLLVGDDVTGQGTRLWLRVGPVAVQPAEILRVGLIVVVAAYLAERGALLAVTRQRVAGLPVPPLEHALPLTGIVGLSVLIVIAQGDFGPAVVYVASFLAMTYLATGRRDYVLAALAIFAVGGLLAFASSDRIAGRVDAWLDPWSDPQGAGYQSLQAIGGLVFGGVAGAGPGYGYPGLIPAAHTDYPLAAIGEEWGLVGTVAVILLYALLVTRGLARAQLAGSGFAMLLAAGLALSLGVQALIVLGGVLRLLPLTGITSPFLSYGGSSMLMSWIMLAVLLRASWPRSAAVAPPPPALAARTMHIGFALLAGLAVLTTALGYWQVVRAADLSGDPAVSGQRLRLESARITRGRILDRNGEVLAETVIGPDGTPERVYHQPGAVHVVGFNSAWLGATGVEQAAADRLMGRHQMRPFDTLRDVLHLERAGADVRLTIDLDLQRAAEEAMAGADGALVALDPRSGDVLAMVSNPTFEPDPSEEAWQTLREDPRGPLLNRAIQGLYTPGSTFKTVTLAAAVEHGLVDAETPATCEESAVLGGVTVTSYNEPPGRRTQSVADAYAYSCNTYFAELGLELGAERFAAMAEALGLTERVPFALPGGAAARLSNTDDFLDSDAGLAASAFGQGELQVTPLHLVLLAAAVANDGHVPRPRLFLDETPEVWRQAMSPETARAVAGMMEHGVEVGWASSAAIPGVHVGGKTGSAEVAEDQASHALYIGFASVDNSRIAIAVVKEYAGGGSQQAAPVARAVINAWLAIQRESTVSR